MLFEIDKLKVESEFINEGPFRVFTMQMNDRLVDSFEMTAMDSDFILFKKTRAEKMIFRRFLRKDCLFRILKPNLGRYMICEERIRDLYIAASEYISRKQFEKAIPYIENIKALTRTEFRPVEILEEQIKGNTATSKKPYSLFKI